MSCQVPAATAAGVLRPLFGMWPRLHRISPPLDISLWIPIQEVVVVYGVQQRTLMYDKLYLSPGSSTEYRHFGSCMILEEMRLMKSIVYPSGSTRRDAQLK